MSETDFLKLKKHDNVETNTEKFDIENYLNGNWDKINENAKKVNTDISNINSKNKEQDTNIEQLQENTETSSNKIAELEKELKEAQEDFYQSSIRGQASGEYIHVEDSSNCRAKIGIGGNHEQETRSGKNYLNTLAKYKAGEKVTVDGITYIFNEDGSITCNGTADTDIIFNFSTLNLQKIDGTSKKLVASINGEYTYTKAVTFIAYDKNFGNTKYVNLTGSNKNYEQVLTDNVEYAIFRIVIYKDTIIKNRTLYLQILDKSISDLTYEQYGASPSPGYPSEIESVGSNVNEFDIDAVKDGFLNEKTGKIISNNSWKCSDFIEILNKTYTFGWESSSDYFQVTVCYYDENKKFISGKSYGLRGTFNNTFEVVSNAKYMKIAYSVSVRGEVATREKIKLEKGTVATPYSKFGQGCVKVTKCNKNILKNIATSGALNGVTRTVNEDKSVTINGTSTGWANLTVGTIKGDGNSYTLSGSLSNSEIFLSVNNSQEGDIAQSKNGNEITFIPKRGLTYNVIICIPSGKTFNNVLIKPLVRISSDKDNTYEQHEEQSYIMPVQQEILKDDYLDFENEEEVHMWGKYTFIGEEDYQKSQTYSNDEYLCAYIPTPVINNIKIDGKGLSSHFNRIGDFTTYQNEECVRTSGQLQIRVLVSRLTENSVEGLKAYLKSQYDAGTPVVVYYQLATPTRLKFTNEQKAVAKELNNARTYKNVTNITTDSKAILSLDYVKDQETQNQKMQNEIDEIKQLLSTTQTSAMLLDNLQKEVESEVE